MSKSTSKSKSKAMSNGKNKHGAKTVGLALTWLDAPAEHDYPSAASFLNLIAPTAQIDVITALLSHAPTIHQAAKDILRAAGLPLLPVTDPEVSKDLARVNDGVSLSPILLVRGDAQTGRALVVADGYHRVCTAYHLGENSAIPCRIVDLPAVVA